MLSLTIFVEEDIVWFDVPVEDHLAVHDVDGREQLLHHGLYLGERHGGFLLRKELAQSRSAVLEDAVNDLVLVAIVLDDIQDLDEVRLVTETLKERNLSHSGIVDAILHVLLKD